MPNVVRAIFAITFASIGAYFARIFPLVGSFLSWLAQTGGVLDRVPEAGDDVLVDVGACDPEGQLAGLRAHRFEGTGYALRPLLECERQVGLREEGRVDGSLRERPEHLWGTRCR